MSNKDLIQRFVFENASVRGEWVRLNKSYFDIIHLHEYPQPLQRLLGEALVVVAMMIAIVKYRGKISLQFQGKSGLKFLLAQCTHDFKIRGLCQFEGNINSETLLHSLEEGTLVITMDPDDLSQRYQGIVNWSGHSLAQSIEWYFKNSEQLPTRIWLAVNDQTAAGLLLQILPKDHSTLHHTKEEDDDWNRIIYLSDTLTEDELLDLDNQTLLKRLYHEDEIRIFSPIPITFQCTCNNERSENALRLLGQAEVEEELNLKQTIVVTCEFCNKEFVYDRVDIANLFSRGGKPPSSSQVH